MSSKNSNLSLYNSKYLKYKNKYLSLKKMVGGMEGPNGDEEERVTRPPLYQDNGPNENINLIVCLPNGDERLVSVPKDEELVLALARKLGVRPPEIQVSLNDDYVGEGLTAEDCDIVNNSRVTVTFIRDGPNENTNVNLIVCLPNGDERLVSVPKDEELVLALARKLGVRPPEIQVSLNDDYVGEGLTAEDCDIVNNSRVTVRFIRDGIRTKRQFREHVLQDILDANVHLDRDVATRLIMDRISTTTDTEDGDMVNLRFSGNGDCYIYILPESFGNIRITGNLLLNDNGLRTLSNNFGNIVVGGHLYLFTNHLQQLPLNFSNIHVGGNIYLSQNMFENNVDFTKPVNVGGDLIL